MDKYDIYHTSDVDINSACSEASPRPLMTITTTMKEVVQFAPCADTSARRKVRLSFVHTAVLRRRGPIACQLNVPIAQRGCHSHKYAFAVDSVDRKRESASCPK